MPYPMNAKSLAEFEGCSGADDCPATTHFHGCYADRGACDSPTEHVVCIARPVTD